MEYDSRMGIAYDTVFYGVIYYNWEAFQKFFLATYGVKDEEYIYFKQIKKALPQPPSSLYPFFFCDFTKASFLSTYFYDNYRFGHESFMPFFKRLQQNAPALLQALFRYFFRLLLMKSITCMNLKKDLSAAPWNNLILNTLWNI